MPETVQIIREARVPLGGDPATIREMIELVYVAPGAFPRTVYIDPDHDSLEERQRIIREDLDAARAATPSLIPLG